MVAQVTGGGDNQFFARRGILDDARDMGDAQVAKVIGAMAAIIEDQPVLRVDGVQEVGAKPDRDPDDAHERSGRRVVFDMVCLEAHGAEKAQIVGGRHEHVGVAVSARPFDGRLRMFGRQAGSENFLHSWRRTEFLFQDRKSTRLNSSHGYISYAVFCLKKKKNMTTAHCHPTIPVFVATAHDSSLVYA